MANPGIGASFDPNDMTSWYFQELSRAEATRLLLNETESGVFLVRDSKTIAGDYVLCVREDDRVSHYIINRVVSADGTIRFRIGDQLFADMAALLSFYRLHYLDTTPLTRPLPPPQGKAASAHHQVLELVVARFDFAGNMFSVEEPEELPEEQEEKVYEPPKKRKKKEKKPQKGLDLKLGHYRDSEKKADIPTDADDLPFRRGERLMVINRDEEQWWTARNTQGRTGSIPVPYVQRILDPSGVPYPPGEAVNHLGGPLSPPRPPPQRTNMQRTLPALARVRQSRVPNAYDKTALSLEEGDIIKVTKININGQWEGELNGRVGHFPFTYVEFIDDNPAS